MKLGTLVVLSLFLNSAFAGMPSSIVICKHSDPEKFATKVFEFYGKNEKAKLRMWKNKESEQTSPIIDSIANDHIVVLVLANNYSCNQIHYSR